MTAPSKCLYSNVKLKNLLTNKQQNSQVDSIIWLTPKQMQEIGFVSDTNEIDFGIGKQGNTLLVTGWSTPENWGVWSDGNNSQMLIPCTLGLKEVETVILVVNTFGQQTIKVSNSNTTKIVTLNGTNKKIAISLKGVSCNQNLTKFQIIIPNANSPQNIGQSNDRRLLGIGITNLILEPK